MSDDEMQIPASAQNAKAGSTGGFDALPGGDYPVMITKTEAGASEKCGGKFYRFEMQVLSGPSQNRVISLFLSFLHPVASLAEKSATMYANLKAATGINSPRHGDYVNKTMIATVTAYKAKKGEKAGQLVNDIVNLKPRHSGPATPPGAPVTDPATAGAPVTNPWGSQA